MISDFLNAAFLWIILGLFVAISCAYAGRTEENNTGGHRND